MSNITTSEWQAWLNQQPIQPTTGGTLHVTGKVDTHSTDFAFLKKKIPQGFNPLILMLDLIVQKGIAPANNPQQVHFPEALMEPQYTSIEILLEGKIIKQIKDIPVVV